MRLYIILFVSLLISIESFAQDTGIKGQIMDGAEGLGHAKVWIEGTEMGTFADEHGHFALPNLSEGTYRVKSQMLGYKETEAEVAVQAGEMKEIVIQMKEDILGLEQVVISATRNEISRKEAPVIVNVINSRTFTSTQSINLAEGLSFQPGLRMEANCQNCGFTQVRMNGLSGQYSQVLIDGSPIFSALNGIYGLEQIPASMIERVEVIRGGGSALYGSNAIAGTINVITKDPVENSFQIGGYYGLIGLNAGDRALNLNTTLVTKSLKSGISIFGMYRDRQAYDHNGDEYSEIPILQNSTFGFKAFYRPMLRKKLSLEFHNIREFRRGGNDFDLEPHQTDITEQLENRVVGVNLSYEQFSEDLAHKFSIYNSNQFTKMDNYYGGGEDINGYGQTDDWTVTTGAQYSYTLDKKRGVFTAGTEYKANRMIDEKPGYNLYVDQTLHLLGIYAQQEWVAHERIRLVGGARLDYNNLTKKWLVNPRANALVDLRKDLQMRASYARGFRAPQVFSEDVHAQLIGGQIQAIRLSPSLQSETSDSYMLSFDYAPTFGDVQMEFVMEGFWTRLHNPFILEELEGTTLPIIEKRNGTGATVRGINLELKLSPIEQLQFQSGFTAQQSFYDDVLAWSAEVSPENLTRDFLRTPNLYGNFLVNWDATPKLAVSVSGVYTGTMWVPHFAGYIAADELIRSRDFFELNSRIGYTFDIKEAFGIEVYGGAQNLLNHYQEDFDIGPLRDPAYSYGPLRPRTIYLGVKLIGGE